MFTGKIHPRKYRKACSNISNKSCIRSEGIDLTFAKYSCIQQDIPLSFFIWQEKTLFPQGIPNRKIIKIC